jgi:2',3'-cyclic-nucleotide 2'-phosphodiesterase (5'-nucleotidase family)
METDVAFANGGGVRHAVSAGDVTYGNLLDIFPFSNSLGSCKATGQQIMDALEYCSKDTQAITALDENAVGEFGGFLQVSGLKYTIDTSVDTSVTVDENGMFTGISGDRRVSDVMVLENGEYVPIDPQKEYTVAGSSYFLFESGDGNTVFKDCERVVA